jgi:hypothetical protein
MQEIFTEQVNKIALLAADDKRYIREDEISTYALANWRLQQN